MNHRFSGIFRNLVCLFSIVLPWFLKRWLLNSLLGYKLHATARIGFSFVNVQSLVMGPSASIGSLNVIKSLEALELGEKASVGKGNWISGYLSSESFSHQTKRRSRLLIGCHSAITNLHILDCTDTIEIKDFTTVAGYRTQILTHSIDLSLNRQDCAPVVIGSYCFVGNSSVILPGATLPDCSVLGALSLLNKSQTETHTLYGGVPACPLKKLSPETAYFHRQTGYVK